MSDLGCGALHGPGRVDEFRHSVYVSAVIHTTPGLGDLELSGSIRFLVGAQTPVGIALIFGSAAFTFREGRRSWRDRTERRQRTPCGVEFGRDDGG